MISAEVVSLADVATANPPPHFHGFRVKITKYGDRLLETIEATIREHHKDKSSSSSNDSLDSKRRRDALRNCNEDDFTQSTARTKKRLVKKQNKSSQQASDHACRIPSDQLELDDINFDDDLFDIQVSEVDQNSRGRELPSWSWSANGSQVHG